jgi:hypothetical protein
MSADFHDLLTEIFPEMRPQRRNSRFEAESSAPPVRVIDQQGHEVLGILDNESYSGIAAIIAGECGLTNNTEVTVEYFGAPMPGMIRRLVRQPDGTYMIGIEWR